MPFTADRSVRAARTRGARSAGRSDTAGTLPELTCLAPIARADARTLILGSMPGAASLRVGQYYAHPRNAFWPIVTALLGLPAELGYPERIAALRAHRIALWDVLATCQRRSSLDADIDRSTARVNDFVAFFAAHPDIERVCCNGGTAAALYERCIAPTLPSIHKHELHRLPSTSPAYAALDMVAKLAAWRAIVPIGS